MDDKDFWEEEYTDLDRYQKRKSFKRVKSQIVGSSPGFGMSGQGTINDDIVRALECNPQGWMITNVSRNAIDYHGSLIATPTMEAEVTIKVWSEDLLSRLVNAMRAMSS